MLEREPKLKLKPRPKEGDRVLETTAQVLTKHIQSKDEVAAILQEIRGATVE